MYSVVKMLEYSEIVEINASSAKGKLRRNGNIAEENGRCDSKLGNENKTY